MSKSSTVRIDKICRVCESKRVGNVWELKPSPIGDHFFSQDQLNKFQQSFPLTLALCESCGYLHLTHIVDPEFIYSEYLYESKITLSLKLHFKEYAQNLLTLTNVKKNSLVVDIGSNDGSMLEAFHGLGMKVLGIEPSVVATKAKEEIPTVQDYFHKNLAEKILKDFGKAAIVTANYMYANIDNVREFTENVKLLLDTDGIFVVQTGYHPEQMKINMFDYIYHEHFSYFTVKVLSKLFQSCGLELFRAEVNSKKGGSVRIMGQQIGGKHPVDKSVSYFIKNEENAGMHQPKTYIDFANSIDSCKTTLLNYLASLTSNNSKLIGYGASVSTTTLIHQFEIGKLFEYLVDDNPIKQGLISPGFHIPVKSPKQLNIDKPEYVVILAWQYQENIIERNQKYLEQGGIFIVPLPSFKIVKA